MAEFEKIRRGLQECSLGEGSNCDSCPYKNADTFSIGCHTHLMKDAFALLDKHRWIPVSARLPETGERVLVISECGNCFTGFYSQLSGWHLPHEGIYPTHWMPQPEPPKEG